MSSSSITSPTRWQVVGRYALAFSSVIAVAIATMGGLHLFDIPFSDLPRMLTRVGWTIFGFVPLALILLVLTIQVLIKRADRITQLTLARIGEISIGLGLLGTLSGFIGVASASYQSATAEEMLPSILAGMSSTFAGIVLNLWAICAQHPMEVEEAS